MRIPESHADELVLCSAEAVFEKTCRHDFVRASAVFVQSEVGLQIFGRRGVHVVCRWQVRIGRRLARVLQELHIARRTLRAEAAEILGLEIACEDCIKMKAN